MGKRLAGLLLAALFATAHAQAPDTAAIAAQRDAMKALAAMDGVWRGPASVMQPNGEWKKITQTERIGPFLGGTLKLVEGRGYDASGAVSFNAFAVISYDAATSSYSMRSYALGRKGDFPLRPTADGYVWEVPAGPGAIIRYTTVIKNNRYHELGERIAGGGAPMKVFEMTLERVGDSDWPEAGAIKPH
jgi:hypothetical protein